MRSQAKPARWPAFLCQIVNGMLVRKGGFEPPRLSAPPPQDGVSASSTTSARLRRHGLRRAGTSIHSKINGDEEAATIIAKAASVGGPWRHIARLCPGSWHK